MDSIEKACAALRAGRPVIIFDGDEREGEADIVFHASSATPDAIAMLRCDGGGLICLATSEAIARRMGLPFAADLLRSSGNPVLRKIAISRSAYGDEPAFSITINHISNYTGVTDEDRATTARRFAEIVARNNGVRREFVSEFRAPGHLHLLIGRGIENRRGHTELALELARRAGLPPAMLLCEMMGKRKALSKRAARKYAREHGLVFLEGRQIWRK